MWHASLDLELAHKAKRTVLTRARHEGPLRVQRPFYAWPEDACHIYILHPPGGVVGGDTLDISVDVQRGGRVLVTTPAATKLYRSNERLAEQRVRLRVAQDAVLEWLPQENICFSGSFARLTTVADLDPGAGFAAWDITCLGRPAAGEGFDRGTCTQRMEIRRAGELIWMERSVYTGGSERLFAPWGLAGCAVSGLLVCAPASAPMPAEVLDLVRSRLAELSPPHRHGATSFGDVLVCRAIGDHVDDVRAALSAAWSALRPPLFGRAAAPPRIWAT